MKLYFIVNEQAGNRQGAKKWQQLKKTIRIPYEAHITQHEKHAIEIIHNLCEQYQTNDDNALVIVIGGDGSLHETLNGLVEHANIVIGAISAGSGNDFKRGYGDFESVNQIEQFLQNGKATCHDLGVIHAEDKEISFVNNCGIGFDATVAIAANESKVKKVLNKVGLGKLCYVFYLIKCLFTFKPFNLVVAYDGSEKIYHNVWFVTASNQPFFGGGMKISPNSRTDDGKLELTVVHNLSKLKLLVVFSTVFFAKHMGFKEVEQMQAEQFTLTMDETYFVHGDGEKLTINTANQPIVCSIKPAFWQLAKK